jgi:SsrA-binding protein
MANYGQNRKARFNYELLEEFEAGLVLRGFEVKAIREGKVSLEGAYVVIRGGEAFLLGASISPYQPANQPKKYEPEATRKLLLNKKELQELERASENQGLTIVPLKWYNKGRKVKLAIALARGKKKVDKRESIKERDSNRDIARILKKQN